MPDFRVFISHLTGERRIAEELQTLLATAFPTIRIFRSSDAESIETGEGQYDAIVSALGTADVLIALLSSDSARRPWVAFESGFALGKRAKLLPVLVRQARAADVPSPFSELLLRPLDETELERILAAIESTLGVVRAPVDVVAAVAAIRQAEAALPAFKLELEPYVISESSSLLLQFRLSFDGYKPIQLQVIGAGIPNDVKEPSWPILARAIELRHGHPNLRQRKFFQDRGIRGEKVHGPGRLAEVDPGAEREYAHGDRQRDQLERRRAQRAVRA